MRHQITLEKLKLFTITMALVVGLFPSTSFALWDTKLSSGNSNSRHPKVVWTGSGYGFVWQEQVGNKFEIKFREANELGVLSPEAVTVSDSTGNAFFPDIAWNGEEYAVVWQDDRSGPSEIYIRYIKSGGEMSDASLRLTYHLDAGAVKQMGDATMTNFDILEGIARRVDKDAGAFQPAIIWNGQVFGVTFADARTTYPEIYFLTIKNNEKEYPEVQVTQNHQNFTNPSIMWDGNAFGLTWENSNTGSHQVLFARVLPTGRVANYFGVMNKDNESARFPTVATNGSDYLMVYENFNYPDSSLRMVRFNQQGKILRQEQIPLWDETAISSRPFITWAQDKYILVWQDERFKKPQTFLAFLDGTGEKTMGDWLLVNSPSSIEPRLAWNGQGAGLVWVDLRDQATAQDQNTEVYFNLFDITAPVVSKIKAEEIRDTEVTLSWTTSELSDASISYLENGAEKIINQDVWTREHEMTLENLWTNTHYTVTLRARDVNDNRVTQKIEFTTLVVAPSTPKYVKPAISTEQTTATVPSFKPTYAPETYAYGQTRVKNLVEEHYRYLGLRRYLQSKLGVRPVNKITQAQWEKYVRALMYGKYPAKVILEQVKTGKQLISDTEAYQVLSR